MAISVYAATILSRSRQFLQNCVTVNDDAVPFVKGGKSVFCKFVTKAGDRIRPRSDVAVIDGSGRVIGVGTSVMSGQFIQQFKTGVAVKVREGLRA
jgi:7-cyano-7-deazaguanine tRNA-ribosyltransferase